MRDVTKHYTRDGIIVTWKSGQCIHSTKCWKELNAVFNPGKHPWIDMKGAELEQIKEQVGRCPSGALSYIEEQKKASADDITTEVTAVEVMKNGPLMVYGNISVKQADGTTVNKNKVTAFCRCGASANKPFCDGAHMATGFKDE